MVTARDVEYAYRLFLGREPENAEVVDGFIKKCHSISDLRDLFLTSPEFIRYTESLPVKALDDPSSRASQPRPLAWGRIPVELSVPNETLAQIIRHVEGTWQNLGKSEPHWSVLTHETFLSNNIGQNQESFFATGEAAINDLRRTAERCGVNLANRQTCFELGCGVGRVTTWLSRMFPQVVATDISAPHLEHAREILLKHNRHNVKLVKLSSVEDISVLPDFDVFYSVIVLQHNPPPIIAHLLSRILTKLLPGGIAYFQVPTYALGYRFNAAEYVQGLTARGMEMHVLPQEALFRIIDDSRCKLLEIREDSWTGDPKMISNSVFVTKPR